MALAINGTTGISGVDGSSSAPAVQGSDSNTGLSFASDTVVINTGGSERCRVDSSGRLLIGTTTNSGTSVSGDDIIIGSIGDSTPRGITFATTADGTIRWADAGDNAMGRIQYLNTSDVMTFHTSNAERFRIDSAGDIGIGTNNTNHKLTVQNSTNQQVGQFLAGSTSYNTTVLQAACSRNTTNGSYVHFKCSINGVADKFRVLDNGNCANTNNSFSALSDETLKENIVDAGSQWNDIKNIRVRKFNFKEGVDPEKPTLLGVIAQEAELVCPNLVESTVQLQEGVEQEYKSFKYSILYMKAIKALQEAQTRIETLETKVAALEAA